MSIYPQIHVAEPLVAIANRILDPAGWTAWSVLEAQSADLLIRMDNARRLKQGLDTLYEYYDVRLSSLETYGKTEPEQETLLRSRLARRFEAACTPSE
jgi:hypothetical protein